MMLTSLPTYSFYKSSYSYNFIKHITLPFCLIPFMFLISFYGITYSVRRFSFHSYHLLSTLQLTSIRIFLNTASFFASLPVVSGVSLTLACKIFYKVMASVESDHTAHSIFNVPESHSLICESNCAVIIFRFSVNVEYSIRIFANVSVYKSIICMYNGINKKKDVILL